MIPKSCKRLAEVDFPIAVLLQASSNRDTSASRCALAPTSSAARPGFGPKP
jgi:hypothetical protein